MAYYAVSDTQLGALRSSVHTATGNYGNTWGELLQILDYFCLKAGTQILMADGTTKNIEDLKYGDMLKSWDVQTNQFIDVKCYGTFGTGRALTWQVYGFENGEVLWIRQSHAIYCVTKGWLVGSSNWVLGWEGIDQNGEHTALACVQDVAESEVNNSFVVFTENNLYFANGILCGQSPKEKIMAYSQGMLPQCTKEEVEHFRAIGKLYDEGRNGRTMNEAYRKEAYPIFAERSRSLIQEKEHQAKLDASDYKNNKRAQGLIDDIEWAEFTVECNNHRDAINFYREQQSDAMKRVKEVQAKHGLKTRKTLKQCFLEAYALDMEFYNKNHAE